MKVLLVAPYGGIPGGISRWTGVSQEPNLKVRHGIPYIKSMNLDKNLDKESRLSPVEMKSRQESGQRV